MPEYLTGSFKDDYNIEYELTEKVFYQKPATRFHILKWNIDEQYFIARSDSLNSYDPNLYSRIDWIKFKGMQPFEWGFCLTAYKANTPDSAEIATVPDRNNPKTGCNGYPFSRMKPITS
ncbi:MAG: hypothetical protein JJ892_07735 [Balneola sp.]|nr:hypothetical protein [Balneola sp.]MBO6651634.1 hypothetical protein [Balneola sp.]MBO6711959.1 hypothetical protein [Balneola sp.]MBO6800155.1 hypothetical protein [Balneola sp.]MBO6871659.1 hypothetical protein [Balneola sp.]